MLRERFVLEEDALAFRREEPEVLEATFYILLDLLDYASDTRGGVVRWSEVWHVASASGRTLSDRLFSSSDLDRDLCTLVGRRLDKIRCWDDDEALDPSWSVTCDGVDLELAPSISLSLSEVLGGRGVACLTTDQTERRGAVNVGGPPGVAAPVHFLVEAQDGPSFWREVAEAEDFSEGDCKDIAALAFPHLRFAPRVWSQLGNLRGGWRELRPQLLRDLAGLNDHALAVWTGNVEPNVIASEMSSRAGVDCSPDSPQTHRNRSAMAERRVDFGDVVVDCEWHTKLERHRNRIHFAVKDGVVYVGVFAEHLST